MKDFNEIMSKNSQDGKFIVKKITKIQDLADGKSKEIPESDVTIQTDKEIIQLSHIDKENEKVSVIIKTGCYSIEDGNFGTTLKKFKLKKDTLLETIDNTAEILSESDKFFKKVEKGIYKQLCKEPRRSMLLCSPPGMGKSAAISKTCEKFLEKKDTAVIIWDTSDVRSSSVSRLFLQRSKFTPNVKKLIFIMEDLNGGTVEDHFGSKVADSSLLNLLDGVGNPFKGVPTFIIATTNNPEQNVSALIDRPGRFDKVIEMKSPDKKQAVELLRFIAKRDLSPNEIEAAHLAAKNEFSIAHLQEIVVRSLIDDITMYDAAEQLVKHKERFKDAFVKQTKSVGIGFGRH